MGRNQEPEENRIDRFILRCQIKCPHQIPCAVRSGQMTLNVRVEDLDGWLDEAAAGEVLLVLHKR